LSSSPALSLSRYLSSLPKLLLALDRVRSPFFAASLSPSTFARALFPASTLLRTR
jgi:hypothetical protein